MPTKSTTPMFSMKNILTLIMDAYEPDICKLSRFFQHIVEIAKLFLKRSGKVFLYCIKVYLI